MARRLTEMPLVAAAFARGELSYSQVRALTRVENVSDEADLIEMAQCASAAQLERIVRGYRTVLEIERGAERQHEERYLSWHHDDQGALILRGRLPAEQGAVIVAALEAARDQFGPPEVPAGEEAEASAEAPVVRESPVPVGARNADALVALAEASLSVEAGSSSAERYQVVVHVDVAQLAEDASDDGPEAEGRCELENGVPLPRQTARRLGCDTTLVRIVERDGKPLSVGRRMRSIPPALRRALRARDGGCSFPGCSQHRHVDAHHIQHWADGGPTELGNLVQLCRHHHRLVHEGGFGVRRGAHGSEFWGPSGRKLPSAPPRRRGDHAALVRGNAERQVDASAGALRPDSLGGPYHLGNAVERVPERNFAQARVALLFSAGCGGGMRQRWPRGRAAGLQPGAGGLHVRPGGLHAVPGALRVARAGRRGGAVAVRMARDRRGRRTAARGPRQRDAGASLDAARTASTPTCTRRRTTSTSARTGATRTRRRSRRDSTPRSRLARAARDRVDPEPQPGAAADPDARGAAGPPSRDLCFSCPSDLDAVMAQARAVRRAPGRAR